MDNGNIALRQKIVSDPRQVESCDLAQLNALDWAFILGEHPELEAKCDWAAFETETVAYYGSPLYGNAWHCLLMKQPQFASRCEWKFASDWDDIGNTRHEGFSRWYWVVLLNAHPEFADKCNWSAFDGCDISHLAKAIDATNRDKIQWSRLNGEEWGRLLAERPDLIDRCDFSSFRGVDWVSVLVKCRELKIRCDWAKLTKGDWQCLLALRPEFAKELVAHTSYQMSDIKVEEWDPLDWGMF